MIYRLPELLMLLLLAVVPCFAGRKSPWWRSRLNHRQPAEQRETVDGGSITQELIGSWANWADSIYLCARVAMHGRCSSLIHI